MDEITRIVVRDRVDFFNPFRIRECPTMQRLMGKLVAHGWAHRNPEDPFDVITDRAYDFSRRYVDGVLTLTATLREATDEEVLDGP